MSRTKTVRKAATKTRATVRRPAKRVAAEPRPSLLTGNRLPWLLSAGLAGLTFAIYAPVLGHAFLVLDDREYVTANPQIHRLGWETVRWAFTSMYAANWHPLTWLSHALDYKFYGLNPLGHHLSGVLIHAVNTSLLFLLLYWMTKRVGPSLFVAALFGLHPINVESVAWIAERKNVLSTFFFLATIAAYTWYAQKPGWRRYLLMSALFAAGLMAKPMLVTLPFVLLLLDYWPLESLALPHSPFTFRQKASGSHPGEGRWARSEKRFIWLLLEKLPLLALSAASSWMTLKAQHAVVQSFADYSLGNRIGNALVAYGLYLWKTVWPAELGFYPHSAAAPPAWQWLLSSAVLIATTVAVVLLRHKRYLPVGWFWFLGTLVPVLGLVQVGGYAMADRYAYISLIGIFVMIAWGAADVAQAKHLSTAWCAVPAVCIVAALSAATIHQIGYWDSDYRLNSHMLELRETPFAHNAVAMALLNPAAALTPQDLENFPSEPARVDEARRHFERALELQQSQQTEGSLWDNAGTLNNLANLDRLQNRLDEAREHDGEALKIYRRLTPQNPDVYLPYLAATLNNLGSVDQQQNRLEEARKNYEESLQINRQLVTENPPKYLPNIAMVLNEYGMADAAEKRFEEARAHYDEALKINRQLAAQSPAVYLPQLAMTLSNYALLDVMQDRMDDARLNYEEALKIDRQLVKQNAAVYLPDLAMTLSDLGRVTRIEGRLQESRAYYLESYDILQKLVQENRAYASEMERVESSLEELQRIPASGPGSAVTQPPQR